MRSTLLTLRRSPRGTRRLCACTVCAARPAALGCLAANTANVQFSTARVSVHLRLKWRQTDTATNRVSERREEVDWKSLLGGWVAGSQEERYTTGRLSWNCRTLWCSEVRVRADYYHTHHHNTTTTTPRAFCPDDGMRGLRWVCVCRAAWSQSKHLVWRIPFCLLHSMQALQSFRASCCTLSPIMPQWITSRVP